MGDDAEGDFDISFGDFGTGSESPAHTHPPTHEGIVTDLPVLSVTLIFVYIRGRWRGEA